MNAVTNNRYTFTMILIIYTSKSIMFKYNCYSPSVAAGGDVTPQKGGGQDFEVSLNYIR